MNSIDFPRVLTTIFVIVDDWYQKTHETDRNHLPGAKPQMSDSEILTLALRMDYLPFPGETPFLGLIRANYSEWFPDLQGRESVQSTTSSFTSFAREIYDVSSPGGRLGQVCS